MKDCDGITHFAPALLFTDALFFVALELEGRFESDELGGDRAVFVFDGSVEFCDRSLLVFDPLRWFVGG